MASPFVDKVTITVRAGDGGNGAVTFHREKYVAAGGPDGGDGGRGGDIIFEVDDNMSTLMDFRYKRKYVAGNGADGQGKRCSGRVGESLHIRVPRGTLLRDADSGAIMHDMSSGEPFVAARGGRGGHRAHGAIDLGSADGVGHLIVADEHAARHWVALHMPEGDVVGTGDSPQGRLVVERDAVLQGAPGDGAVHGPRVQAGEAELFGHGLGHGGLSGPRRPVDGDDHYFTNPFKSARKSG